MSTTSINKNAQSILWLAFALTLAGFILPVAYVDSYSLFGTYEEPYSLFDVLDGTGILMYLCAIGLLGMAAGSAKVGDKSRWFGIGGTLLLIPSYLAIQEFIQDNNDIFGGAIARGGLGQASILFAIFVGGIGSLLVKNTIKMGIIPPSKSQPSPGHGYPQGYNQGYQPQPYQPQSYQPQANQSNYQQPNYQQPQPQNPTPSYSTTTGGQTSYCGNCGSQTKVGDAFCNTCGTKL